MSYRFAVIGCRHGHIARFIDEMKRMGHTCAGIYDSGDGSLARKLAEDYNVPYMEKIDALLEPSVQIVGTSAINNEKMDIVELCERHDKAVMADKPLVTDRAGLERLENVLKRGRIQVGLMLTERYRRSVLTLKRRIDEGALGDITEVAIRRPLKLYREYRDPWFFSKTQNGGIIADLMIHDMDLLRWLTGEPIDELHAVAGKSILPEYPDFYDTAKIQAVLGGRIAAGLHADWHAPEKGWAADGRLFVTGTKGCAEVRLSGDPAIAEEELLFTVYGEQRFQREELAFAESGMCEDFIRRIEGVENSGPSHTDLWEVCKAVISADENARRLKIKTEW